LMSDHYRSDRMWSDLVLHNAQDSITRLKAALSQEDSAPTEDLINSIVLALSNDLDTPSVVSAINTWSKETLTGAVGGNSDELRLVLDALLGIKI
jgi:L-cysteine:1D-myo-inositol 2-amino-2-deoxy-alpha-D-glucopyranoside ligase